MVNRKEILIQGRLYEVTTIEQYSKCPDAFLNGYVALDVGQQYILPVVPANSQAPGITLRKNAPFSYAREPEGEIAEQYERKNVIDYTKADTFKSFVETQNMVRELEKDILTSPDNIYVPPQDVNDSPAMKALKEAVVKKHIDLDKYEPRLGSNYNNDKRIFNKNNISLPMTVRMCNALDIKATLVLEDQIPKDGGEVPNPIGEVISVELTSGGRTDEEE